MFDMADFMRQHGGQLPHGQAAQQAISQTNSRVIPGTDCKCIHHPAGDVIKLWWPGQTGTPAKFCCQHVQIGRLPPVNGLRPVQAQHKAR